MEDDALFREEILPDYEYFLKNAYKLAGSHGGEDLLHKTLIRVYENMSSYQSGTNARAWVHMIMRNTFINDYRRKKKFRALINEDKTSHKIKRYIHSIDPSFLMESSPEDCFLNKEIDPYLKECINSIREPHKETWALVEIGGLSYKEAAQELGVPIGTVMSRIFRARQFLRPLLQDLAYERKIIKEKSF